MSSRPDPDAFARLLDTLSPRLVADVMALALTRPGWDGLGFGAAPTPQALTAVAEFFSCLPASEQDHWHLSPYYDDISVVAERDDVPGAVRSAFLVRFHADGLVEVSLCSESGHETRARGYRPCSLATATWQCVCDTSDLLSSSRAALAPDDLVGRSQTAAVRHE